MDFTQSQVLDWCVRQGFVPQELYNDVAWADEPDDIQHLKVFVALAENAALFCATQSNDAGASA